MQEIYKLIGKISSSNVTVLITGESGSGKELIAKAIHNNSPRSEQSFLAVNCTAIAETLIESEFFGHEKGSFTGAVNTKIGKFEMADGGTLFLDEIGDMSPDIQAKLLRVLQEREIVRVGGNKNISIDVRIIAATNRDLEKNIVDGRFREDLYHRLKVVSVHIPPLRERKEDIVSLTEYFIKTLNAELNTDVTSISPEAMDILMKYNWPGNIRELRNCIESAIAIHRETTILVEHLPKEIVEKVRSSVEPTVLETNAVNDPAVEENTNVIDDSVDLKNAFLQYLTAYVKEHIHHQQQLKETGMYSDIISMVEKIVIREALEHFDGNQVKTAKFLNINRNTLRSKVEKHNI